MIIYNKLMIILNYQFKKMIYQEKGVVPGWREPKRTIYIGPLKYIYFTRKQEG